MKTTLTLIILFIFLSAGSCQNIDEIDPNSPRRDIKDASDEIATVQEDTKKKTQTIDKESRKVEDETKQVDQETKNIDENIDEIENQDTVNEKYLQYILDSTSNIRKITQTIRNRIRNIKNNTSEIREVNERLDEAQMLIQKVDDKTQAALKDLKRLKKENERLQSSYSKALNNYLNITIMIGVFVFAAGVALFFYGNKIGISLGICGLILAVVALVFQAYMSILIWVGGLALLVIVVGFFAQAFVFRQEVKKRKQKEQESYEKENRIKEKDNEIQEKDRNQSDLELALRETIATVETIKQDLDNDRKIEFFGEGARPGIVDLIQSENTKEKVLDERKKMAERWSPTMPIRIKPEPDSNESGSGEIEYRDNGEE